MVGVPKSQGCKCCRQIKKGCDQKRPACGRCARLRLKCDYARESKFIEVHPAKDTSNFVNYEAPASAKSFESDSVALLPRGCERSAMMDQSTGYFWSDFLPQQSGKANGQLPWSFTWLQSAFECAYQDPMLSTIISALTISRLGRAAQDPTLIQTATSLQCSAIAMVRRAVMHKESCSGDTLLATVMMLALYEIHEGSPASRRGSAWVAHVKGARILFQERGEKNYKTSLGRQLSRGLQYNEFVDTVGSRKPTPPLLLQDQPSELFAVLSLLPAIYNQADSLRLTANKAEFTLAYLDLGNTVLTFQTRLKVWYSSLQISHPGPLFWPQPSLLYLELPEDSPERIFPSYFHFQSLDIAEQIVLYWTALLLTETTLYQTQNWLKSSTFRNVTSNSGITFMSEGSHITLGLNILQSLEFFVQPEAGLVGAQLSGFPLSAVNACLRTFNYTKELIWTRVIIRKYNSLGIQLSGFLDDISKGEALRILNR